MKLNQLKSIATKYYVDDLRDSSVPGTSLSNVICRLELAPDYIPEITKDYLRKSKLNGLLKYACNQVSFDEFTHVAKLEQEKRIVEAEIYRKKQAKQAEINAERKRKQKVIRNLLKKFDLDLSYVRTGDVKKIVDILEKVEFGTRLNQEELAWLMVSRNGMYSGYYTDRLRKKYHKIEAEYYFNKYQKSKNPWDVINSSSHFRKCNCSRKAASILVKINTSNFKSKKVESAFNTTYGGVKRDLGAYDEAIMLGKKAHTLTPKNFRPCTLLGAVNIEMGNYAEGQSWYKKAIDRGASEKSVDDDLRSIFKRSDKSKRRDLAVFLLNRERERYGWVEKYLK